MRLSFRSAIVRLTDRTVSKDMARSKNATQLTILDAPELVLRRSGAHAATMQDVARTAGCTKGLLHYHFQTKQLLLVETVGRMAASRRAAWAHAFDVPDPHAAIDRTWAVIVGEEKSGTLRAWSSLLTVSQSGIDQAVRTATSQFRDDIAVATEKLLRRAGFRSTIPATELGWLLAAVVQGMAFQLAAGADPETLENAYAAAWLGILSLTTGRD